MDRIEMCVCVLTNMCIFSYKYVYVGIYVYIHTNIYLCETDAQIQMMS